jgi:hypothetical protein
MTREDVNMTVASAAKNHATYHHLNRIAASLRPRGGECVEARYRKHSSLTSHNKLCPLPGILVNLKADASASGGFGSFEG